MCYGQNTNTFQSVDNVEAFDFKRDIAEIFDLGSGVFAAVLFVLSLIAYVNLRQKRMLYVSIAFALFAVRTIISRSDLFMPEIESSLLEMMLGVMSFIALSLFFLAIVRKEKVRRKMQQATCNRFRHKYQSCVLWWSKTGNTQGHTA